MDPKMTVSDGRNGCGDVIDHVVPGEVQVATGSGEPVAGRKTSARAFDALIAAVAIANDLPLYTVNPKDFTGIDGLEGVAVPHPDQGS